jgi:hypothetical protein
MIAYYSVHLSIVSAGLRGWGSHPLHTVDLVDKAVHGVTAILIHITHCAWNDESILQQPTFSISLLGYG